MNTPAVNLMSEPHAELARAIGRYLDARATPPPEMAGAVRHLRDSLRCAVPAGQVGRVVAAHYEPLLRSALAGTPPKSMAEVAAALVALPCPLPWEYPYVPRAQSEDLGARIGFAELIGPDGPLQTRDCRVGFTLIAPHTFYPLHAHPAVELYLVIAGHAEWSAQIRQVAPPGAFVLHRSNEPHAMRTFEEPLLALYSWSGDLDTAAYYV